MITTEKTRKQRPTSSPENRRRPEPYAYLARRDKSSATNLDQDYEKRLKNLQKVQEEQEERLKILQKIIFKTAQKSTAKSFSLQDLEKDPAYKYGACITRLKGLFKTDQDVEEWLNSHESGLPQTPLQYMEEGEFELVEGLIGMIEYGIPS